MSTKIITLKHTDLLSIAAEKGCQLEDKKSWTKVTFGQNRKAVYIAKSKRVLTKVHFSGFVVEEDAIIKALTKEEAKSAHLGAVRGEIDVKTLRDVTNEDVIDAFTYGLFEMMGEEEGFKMAPKKAKEEEEVKEETEEVDLTGLEELALFATDED